MGDNTDVSGAIARFIIWTFLLLLALGIVVGIAGDEQGQPDDGRIVAVEGILASSPEYRIYTNGQMRGVTLRLREYPTKAFMIDGDELERTRYMMMKNYLLPGDSVFLQVVASHMSDSGRYSVTVYAARSSHQIYLAE